ncbi:50S ribosomal protein L10 [Dethiosulfovibrio sp. F2B]|uniref:50S ribosomal protein L10 n=1 Tax=Dethiosulfovibrio faecalis TaxID=2720018 RepID=UPI001F1F9574|nr:50S ribosomal protein L10 [Dethiosulfovibrio faecalis]MCF4151842.1 50S ribosomal protein L10 [Dethiosulfovibrio faecalis]
MPASIKFEMVSELKDKLKGAEAVFVCEYRGLTVAQATEVRRLVREAGGEVKVAKNTLVRIALGEVGMAVPEDITVGPNAYVIAHENSPAIAKAIKEFASKKENKAMVIKGGLMGSNVLSLDQVMALADLPSRDQMLAQLVGTLAGPIRGLVTVLSGPSRGLVTCLSQLAEKKGSDAA